MTRTDPHRPGVIDPTEYEVACYFADERGEEPPLGVDQARERYLACGAGIHGGLFQCDICGARYRYGALFWHGPTRSYISTGETCAAKLELAFSRGEFKRLREDGKRAAEQRATRRRRWENLRGFVDSHRGDGLLQALRCKHPLVRSIRSDLIRGARWKPRLSEKQEELVLRLAREYELPPEKHVPVPDFDGRTQVEGVIASVKTHDGPYGSTLKMTVKVETPDGIWICWGTIPDALFSARDAENKRRRDGWHAQLDEAEAAGDEEAFERIGGAPPPVPDLRGCRVRFTATVQRGDRDAHFGFFKRPSKAEVVAFSN